MSSCILLIANRNIYQQSRKLGRRPVNDSYHQESVESISSIFSTGSNLEIKSKLILFPMFHYWRACCAQNMFYIPECAHLTAREQIVIYRQDYLIRGSTVKWNSGGRIDPFCDSITITRFWNVPPAIWFHPRLPVKLLAKQFIARNFLLISNNWRIL